MKKITPIAIFSAAVLALTGCEKKEVAETIKDKADDAKATIEAKADEAKATAGAKIEEAKQAAKE
ncbi:MAG: hypothetical protein WCF18_22160, partial [Chthoniobacteraceae bacterium]